MTKPTNEFRILRLLYEYESLSHVSIRRELNLSIDSYRSLRADLTKSGLVEKGDAGTNTLALTQAGSKEYEARFGGQGSVKRENALYEPLCGALRKRSDPGIVLNVGSLRRKGVWNNPDVIQIIARPSALGLGTIVRVVSYEVKRWLPVWNLSFVFEAAAHASFCHESYLVLEWAKNIKFSHDYLDEYGKHILEACRRFGVGLYILVPHKSEWRLDRVLLAVDSKPSDLRVHENLEYVLLRKSHHADAESLRQLATGLKGDAMKVDDEA